MTDDQLADILQTCLDQLASGATIETCLAGYPAQQADLEPLLRAAIEVASLPRPPLPAAARAAIEQRMLEQVAVRRLPPAGRSSAPLPTLLGPFGLPLWLILVVSLGFGLLLIMALLFAPALVPDAQPLTPTTTAITTHTAQLAPTTPLPSTPRPPGTALTRPTAETIVQRSPIATVETIVIIPPVTAKPAPPANPPGAAPSEPGDDQSRDKNCQGRQLGRDDKKCNPDKPDKPDKKDDDKGNHGKDD